MFRKLNAAPKLCFLLLCLFVNRASAQKYGNEWIDTAKVHVKFNIGKDGIYRIGYFSLEQFFTDANVFLNKIPFDRFRLFTMGNQVPIYVKDNNNNKLWDVTDYIEFVGHPIDGKLDAELYDKPEYQRHTLNTYLLDDSGSYFLTYRNAGTPLRYADYVNPSPPITPARSFYIAKQQFAPMVNYAPGQRVLVGDKDIYLCSYSNGEGFCGEYFFGSLDLSAINYKVAIPTPYYVPAGPAPILESGIVGISNCAYNKNHRVRFMVGPDLFTSRNLHDTTFSSTNPITINRTLVPSDIGSNFTYLTFNSTLVTGGCGGSTCAHSHSILAYPKEYRLDDSIQLAYTEDTSSVPFNVVWNGYGDGFFSLPVVFDETNGIRIEGAFVLGQKKVKFTYPAISQKGKVFMQDEVRIKTLNFADARSVRMFDYSKQITDATYLMVTARALNISQKEEIKQYAQFWGTRYNVFVNEIEDLYNSFGYGLKHPLAIRKWCKYLLETAPANKEPKFLLLIGRGFDMYYNHGTSASQLTPHLSRNFIPAMGTPVSDNLFTAGLKGALYEPAIPTGRLSIDKPEELLIYLDKLASYVNSINNYDEWQKRVLHLSGGATPGQAAVIQNRMEKIGRFVTRNPFAGIVHSYSKSAGGAVDVNFRTAITNELNTGCGLVSFLGHGSSSVTDVDIGDPKDYLNFGKYPIFYFNGCQVGNPCIPIDIKQYIPLSEKLIKFKDKGGVAFLGQTSTSELYTVASQMEFFYQSYFDSIRDKSLGKVLQTAIKNFQSPNATLNRIHCEELLLQGDPALPVFAPSLPDFSVSEASLFLDPPNTVALQDSFRVGVIVTNKGKGVIDSFNVNLSRVYPDGTTRRNYSKRWLLQGNSDTVFFVIRSKDRNTGGKNVFSANLNPEKKPIEFKYENNFIQQEFVLPTNGLNLISPNRFAIVGTDSVEFIAEANDLFKQNDDYYFELDTTPNFNSVKLISLEKNKTPITSSVIAKWKVKLPVLKDSQMYFWRARLSSAQLEGGAWVMYSFTYIKDHSVGWMQNVAWQYNNKVSNNSFTNLTADTVTQSLQFSKILKKIYMDCSYNSASNLGVKEAGFSSQDLNYGVCKTGLVCMPWDGRKLVRTPLNPSIIYPDCYWGRAWESLGHIDDYQLYYAFDMSSSAEQDNFVKFINTMPDSMYVTIYTRLRSSADQWKPEVISALNKIGSAFFDTVSRRTDDAMWVALGKKGWKPGVAQEAMTFGRQFPYVQLEGNMVGDAQLGNMISEKMGPVNAFNKFYFTNKKDKTLYSADDLKYNIYGIPSSGLPTLLYSGVKTPPQDLSTINTYLYKYIQLEVVSEDKKDNSSPNMGNWRVTHDPVPEGSIYPNAKFGYQFHDDTLYEGDTFYIKLPFKNIGTINFRDSIRLDYSCYHKTTRNILSKGQRKYTALNPDSAFYFAFKLPTTGLAGPYVLQVNINQFFEQPEITLVNNSALINFYVTKDLMSPLLDITFDGRHILQGDVVSANPIIQILSKDENKYLLQKDSSTFDLLLKRPESNVFEMLKWGSEARFYAAQNKENKARIEYRPADLSNGSYTLKVQSRDASKNLSGALDYEILFNVVREESVTHFYPYPNPFTSSMRFVFTLTGTNIPDEIKIKIMTAEGRVVKELNKEDLGDVHVGNNITSWAWDGTDQFGDKLGNGTYFYKVSVKNNGQELKLRQSAGDASFKEQVGVIYLLR